MTITERIESGAKFTSLYRTEVFELHVDRYAGERFTVKLHSHASAEYLARAIECYENYLNLEFAARKAAEELKALAPKVSV